MLFLRVGMSTTAFPETGALWGFCTSKFLRSEKHKNTILPEIQLISCCRFKSKNDYSFSWYFSPNYKKSSTNTSQKMRRKEENERRKLHVEIKQQIASWIWARILITPLTAYVKLGKLLNLCKPCFPHFCPGHNNRRMPLERWFLPRGNFPPKGGRFAASGDILWSQLGEGRIQWVQARDAAQHFTVHRTALITRDYLTQNVSRVRMEKFCSLEQLAQVLIHKKYSVISSVVPPPARSAPGF